MCVTAATRSITRVTARAAILASGPLGRKIQTAFTKERNRRGNTRSTVAVRQFSQQHGDATGNLDNSQDIVGNITAYVPG
jgi:hypothetical protein